jgi:hypothetical protein
VKHLLRWLDNYFWILLLTYNRSIFLSKNVGKWIK